MSSSSQISKPIQISLFSLVDEVREHLGELETHSNAIGGIDIVPRFNRGTNPYIPINESPEVTEICNPYYVNGIKLYCNIKPAQLIITDKNKKQRTVLAYAGDREEMVERALFYLAAQGSLIKKQIPGSAPRFGIEFSLYDIRKVLKSIGKTKPYDDIKEALLVLRDSTTTITHEAPSGRITEITNRIFVDSIFQREGSGRGKEKCFITFSDYVIRQILDLNFRQYNFSSVNSHRKTVSTFIHSFLSWNWLNITDGAKFNLDPEIIMQGYGKSNISTIQKRRDVRAGLIELADKGLITEAPRLTKGIYCITATKELTKQIINANRKKKGIETLSERHQNGQLNNLPSRSNKSKNIF